MSDRDMRQLRTAVTDFKTREDGEDLYIEGYFAVFDSNYDIWPGASESIAPGAFTETIESDDIRALTNHNTDLVLGRNRAGTLTLREDTHGLWGSIKINPKDSDAVNTRERVLRGDVSQCSIGFGIINEDAEYRDDGSVHWTIRKVKLYEVSVCTFPAYTETNVNARKRDFEEIQKRRSDAWRLKIIKTLKGESENA